MKVQRQGQLPIVAHALPVAERPRCFGCGMPRDAVYRTCNDDGEWVPEDRATGRAFSHWRGYGHFHSQDCATRYANWVAENEGIRLTIPEARS